MKYKILVSDLDGTLLNRDSKISSLNKKAIFDCINNGIEIILATGKSQSYITKIVNLFDLKLPQITQNGGVVVNANQDILFSVKINPKVYFNIIKILKDKDLKDFLITLENGTYFFEKYNINMENSILTGEDLKKVDKVEQDYYANNVASITLFIEENNPLENFLKGKFHNMLQVVRCEKNNLDILNINATKGIALKKICKMYNIKTKEVVAFGDNPNDLSLFDQAGLSIAVKNAHNKVLEKAHIITSENYNSGVAKAIYKYIL
ncbi:MAG: HAD family hydrolase [Candidatus Humimicrobiaceae bacterium]